MKQMKRTLLMLGAMAFLLIASCSRKNDAAEKIEHLPNEVILSWNEISYLAFGGANYQHSLMASRINAMVHIAMHDALNAVYPKYSTYVFKGKDAGADPVAAAAAAAHTVLLHEIQDKKGYLDSALWKTLITIADGEAKFRGIELGKSAGLAIISDRAYDGSAGNPLATIATSMTPGVYQAVPPFDFYFAPFWENVKLFGIQTKDQFRSFPPPPLNSEAYATAFNEVKETGRLNSASRTTDQTFYAKFWYEFSEAGWNRVARVVVKKKKLGLMETARLFALVDMAIADAYIAGWDSKLHYNFWRPYTAIRKASNDGNKQTTDEQQWQSEMPRPPIQDYPSTHSALGAAAATVLAHELGDNTSFSTGSPTAIPSGATRSFSSFSEAARENADSRVRAGIHFRFACDAGLELGNRVGNWISTHSLKPLN